MAETAPRALNRVEEHGQKKEPLVWLLAGKRTGDNNQLLALADALGWPFEIKTIDFNGLRRIRVLRRGLALVRRSSRALIRPPWPDLVLCVGYASVPVARFIRERTGGRAKLVHIGNPRSKLEDFDLQITTPQYPRRAANLLELPFPIGNPARKAGPTKREMAWLERFPAPRRLVAVGGPARHWRLNHERLIEALETLKAKQDGSLIVAVSSRTDRSTRNLLRKRIAGPNEALVDHFPRFAVLLAQSDEVHVTADSVSMLAEAILSGRRVGMIPIKRSPRGILSHWTWERLTGRNTLPDFRNFWRLLHRHKLVGTVERPLASCVSDTVEVAAKAVGRLLSEDGIGQSE